LIRIIRIINTVNQCLERPAVGNDKLSYRIWIFIKTRLLDVFDIVYSRSIALDQYREYCVQYERQQRIQNMLETVVGDI